MPCALSTSTSKSWMFFFSGPPANFLTSNPFDLKNASLFGSFVATRGFCFVVLHFTEFNSSAPTLASFPSPGLR